MTTGKQPAPAPKRPAQPSAPAPTAGSRAPGKGKQAFRKTIGILVPAVSIVVTYYLTNRLGGMAAMGQKMNLPPQLIPMVISMLVGGLARQITK